MLLPRANWRTLWNTLTQTATVESSVELPRGPARGKDHTFVLAHVYCIFMEDLLQKALMVRSSTLACATRSSVWGVPGASAPHRRRGSGVLCLQPLVVLLNNRALVSDKDSGPHWPPACVIHDHIMRGPTSRTECNWFLRGSWCDGSRHY